MKIETKGKLDCIFENLSINESQTKIPVKSENTIDLNTSKNIAKANKLTSFLEKTSTINQIKNTDKAWNKKKFSKANYDEEFPEL